MADETNTISCTKSPAPKSNVKTNPVFKKKIEPLAFDDVKKYDTLFEGCITDADEVYLVQTPAEINFSSLANNVDFDSSVSKLKCKINKRKKRFNVHVTKNSSYTINLLVPSKRMKSFQLRTYPLTGRIILQETEIPKSSRKRTTVTSDCEN